MARRLITSGEPPPDNRFLRAAVVASILVHLLFWFAFLGASSVLLRLVPQTKATPDPEEMVTISSAIRIERRPKPVPAPPPPKPARPQPESPESLPQQEQLPRPAPAPLQEKHELALPKPSAPAQVPKRSETEEPSRTPTAPPQRQPRATVNSRLSDEQIAQIQSDMARTIAKARSESNPLDVPRPPPPAAPKHYRLSMLGVPGDMKTAQGICNPIKDWYAEGFDYYYVSCNVAISDGTVKVEAVPWPVRFP